MADVEREACGAAGFEDHPATYQREDWAVLQNGFVTMFWQRDRFEATRSGRTADGYLVVGLDADPWQLTTDMFDAFSAALDFPDYFGRNHNALVDCLRDVVAFDYGSDATSTGTVIALSRFDAFAAREPATAWVLLDISADAARSAIVLGHRFIGVLQSDDPAIAFDPVGARQALRGAPHDDHWPSGSNGGCTATDGPQDDR